MRILKRTGRKNMPTSLNAHDEFLLTLMRLQLGLLNEDLQIASIYNPQNPHLFLQLG